PPATRPTPLRTSPRARRPGRAATPQAAATFLRRRSWTPRPPRREAMTAGAAVFYLFAAITVGSAAVVVLARSLIYSAFALLFTFFGVAGLYVLLGADFLAATQLLIYVGGILVLLLFGVMLTHKLYDLDLRSEVTQFVPGVVLAAGLFAVLTITAL